MPSQLELFDQMTIVLDRLIENAKKMKEGIMMKSSQDEIEELQNLQHEILSELGKLNTLLEDSPPGATEQQLDACKARIRDKLTHFQNVNKEFFDHIAANSRVIDAKDLRQKKSKKSHSE